jgi:hypothetical protein
MDTSYSSAGRLDIDRNEITLVLKMALAKRDVDFSSSIKRKIVLPI